MNKMSLDSLWPVTLLALAILPGCQTKPAFIRPDYNPEQVGRIAVLPVMDNRKTPDPKHDFKNLATATSEFVTHELKFQSRYYAFSTT